MYTMSLHLGSIIKILKKSYNIISMRKVRTTEFLKFTNLTFSYSIQFSSKYNFLMKIFLYIRYTFFRISL